MWTLAEAVDLVQKLEPHVRLFGYHTLLAGGVLHHGSSQKDVDIVFLKLHANSGKTHHIARLVTERLGVIKPFFEEADLEADYAESMHPYASVMGKIDWNGKRIDVFIQ